MTKSRENGSTRRDSASITRIYAVAHRSTDEIAKNFGLRGTPVDYRKTLAL